MNRHCTFRRVLSRVALLLVLGAGVAPLAMARPGATPPTAFVDVSVATLWNSPDSPRPVDAPSLTNPVHIQKWLDDMTVKQRAWFGEHNILETQALYGHKVYILQQKGDWVQVAVPDQTSPKNPLGYPGWVPKVQIVHSPHFAALQAGKPFAVVDSAPTVWLYGDQGLTKKFLRISFNTRLPVLARRGDAIEVATPTAGPKWLSAKSASVYEKFSDIPKPTPADLVKTARMFLGKPYLWGGRSGFAYDCSGFVGSIYQSHGIMIPRDAGAQGLHGKGVKVSGHPSRVGTLMFYAHDHGKGGIYHVTMYIGDGKMAEAYAAGTPVRITKARYGDNYWGAERILGTPAQEVVAAGTDGK